MCLWINIEIEIECEMNDIKSSLNIQRELRWNEFHNQFWIDIFSIFVCLNIQAPPRFIQIETDQWNNFLIQQVTVCSSRIKVGRAVSENIIISMKILEIRLIYFPSTRKFVCLVKTLPGFYAVEIKTRPQNLRENEFDQFFDGMERVVRRYRF